MKRFKIIEVKSELGAGTRGASLGIDAMKIAALNAKSDFYAQYPIVTVQNENQRLHESVQSITAKRIGGVVQMYRRISSLVSKTLKNGQIPVILSGDHSNAGGSMAGIKMAFPDQRIGVIWIDAHADMHSPYTSPSGNIHGMPLATAIAEDNLEKKHKIPSDASRTNWEKLKNIGGISPKIQANDIVFIALRDFEEPEAHLIDKYKMPVFTTEQVNERGPETICNEALTHLADCDQIYVTFDVDSLDASISSGTGTPVPGGLTVSQATHILGDLVTSGRIVCLEITEVNPLLDTQNRMAIAAQYILEKVMQIWNSTG